MKVKLIIYSNLKRYVEGYNIDSDDGIIKEVTNQKSIKEFLEETIKHKLAMDAISMVIINNKVVPFGKLGRRLENNDVIKIYPPMGGG